MRIYSKALEKEEKHIGVRVSPDAHYRSRELFHIEGEQKRERVEKYDKSNGWKNWVQVNRKTTLILMEVAKKSPYAVQIWNFFTAYIDGQNAIMVSYKTMQEILNISRATISRGVKLLQEAGLLYTYKSGNANVYILNPESVWSRWGKEKSYCKFPATIVMSLSEQEKATQKIIKEKLNRVSYKEEVEEDPVLL